MNIFNKVTLKGLKRNRTRTIVTIIGVVLSVAMITAVTTFVSSLQNYLIQGEIARSGNWHINYMNRDYEFTQELSADDEIKSTAIVQNIGYTLLDQKNNNGSISTRPYLFVAGLDDTAFDLLPVKLISGRLPQNSDEITVPANSASEGRLSYLIGDTLTLEMGVRYSSDGWELWEDTPFLYGYDSNGNAIADETLTPQIIKTYTVVGLCQRTGFEIDGSAGWTIITKYDSALKPLGDYSAYVNLKNPANAYNLAEKFADTGYIRLNSDLLAYYGVSNNNTFNMVVYGISSILIVLIMAGSILLICNTFSISVGERTRQFGILSSVGMTKKQLRKSVLFEGFCIGIIGIPVGLTVGIGGIGVALNGLGEFFRGKTAADIPLSLSVSLPAILIAIVASVVTILVSAYIPARKAAKRSAIDSIRQTDDIKINPKAVRTSKLTELLFGLPGILASKNFKRNRKRYRATILSLFISIVLFISSRALGLYVSQGADLIIYDTGYDIAFIYYPPDGSNPQENLALALSLYEQFKNVGGITDSGYSMTIRGQTEVPEKLLSDDYLSSFGSSVSNFNLIFMDDISYANYLEKLGLLESEYIGENAKFPAVGKMNFSDATDGKYYSFDVFSNTGDIDLSVHPIVYNATSEEQLAAKQIDKELSITVVNTLPNRWGNDMMGLYVFIPYSMMNEFEDLRMQNITDSLLLTFLTDDYKTSAADMREILKREETALQTGTQVLIVTPETLERNRNEQLVINVFTLGFTVLMGLVAIANVFNTISSNIRLRRREFAMLKSMGMDNRSFRKMMNFECVFYGLKALIYGLPISLALTWWIYKTVGYGAQIAFTLPWTSIVIAIAGVFLLVFVIMLYSTNKLKKDNTLDTLA